MIIMSCRPDVRAKDIYFEAFPPEERRDWEAMPVGDMAFRFYVLLDDGRDDAFVRVDKGAVEAAVADLPVVGLVTVWCFGDFSYIEHLAVLPSMRGRGIGAGVLAALDGALLLEVEPPESGEMARRRIGFYERNGFRLLDACYVQPPYAPGLPEVPLKLMARGDVGDVQRAISTLHTRVYGKLS